MVFHNTSTNDLIVMATSPDNPEALEYEATNRDMLDCFNACRSFEGIVGSKNKFKLSKTGLDQIKSGNFSFQLLAKQELEIRGTASF